MMVDDGNDDLEMMRVYRSNGSSIPWTFPASLGVSKSLHSEQVSSAQALAASRQPSTAMVTPRNSLKTTASNISKTSSFNQRLQPTASAAKIPTKTDQIQAIPSASSRCFSKASESTHEALGTRVSSVSGRPLPASCNSWYPDLRPVIGPI